MTEQLDMFGPPEPIESYPKDSPGRHDDAPVPCERQLLWPADLAATLGPDLCERLYGEIPGRTRLYVLEICRLLRCDSKHVYNLRAAGSLDACDIGCPGTSRAEWRFYRYSLVRWLFNREFRDGQTRSNLSADDMQRIRKALEVLKKGGA